MMSTPTRAITLARSRRGRRLVPIFVDGKVVGEIDIGSHTPAAFTDADRAFLEEVVQIVADYIALSLS